MLLIDTVDHTTSQVILVNDWKKLLLLYSNIELFVAQDADEVVLILVGATVSDSGPLPPVPKPSSSAKDIPTQQGSSVHRAHCPVSEDRRTDRRSGLIRGEDTKSQRLVPKLQLRRRESMLDAIDISKLLVDLLDLLSICSEVRSKRITITIYMHADDGNIHVDILVCYNDRVMMKRAEKTVGDIMAEVVELRGVISGEYGISIRKNEILGTIQTSESLVEMGVSEIFDCPMIVFKTTELLLRVEIEESASSFL